MQEAQLIKAGVDLRGVQPQMAIAFAVAQAIFARRNYDCVITSGSDGKHGPNSLHYCGKALDLRTRHLRSESIHPLFTELKAALGAQFDVVLESDHIHLEFDPKEPEKQPDEA